MNDTVNLITYPLSIPSRLLFVDVLPEYNSEYPEDYDFIGEWLSMDAVLLGAYTTKEHVGLRMTTSHERQTRILCETFFVTI